MRWRARRRRRGGVGRRACQPTGRGRPSPRRGCHRSSAVAPAAGPRYTTPHHQGGDRAEDDARPDHASDPAPQKARPRIAADPPRSRPAGSSESKASAPMPTIAGSNSPSNSRCRWMRPSASGRSAQAAAYRSSAARRGWPRRPRCRARSAGRFRDDRRCRRRRRRSSRRCEPGRAAHPVEETGAATGEARNVEPPYGPRGRRAAAAEGGGGRWRGGGVESCCDMLRSWRFRSAAALSGNTLSRTLIPGTAVRPRAAGLLGSGHDLSAADGSARVPHAPRRPRARPPSTGGAAAPRAPRACAFSAE